MEHYFSCLLVSSVIAFLLYLNTFNADFAYDDSRAVEKNPDLLPETPFINLFYNDFWGTPLTNSGSHKSYRPICVLSFRLNYYFGKLNPWGYHFTNVLLHALVTILFTHLSSIFLQKALPTILAGLLFASHPVHTEAVAGVVGRADVGACLFFLLGFLSYRKYVFYRDGYCDGQVELGRDTEERSPQRFLFFFLSTILATLSMLTKEQGITVLAICTVYELLIQQKVAPWKIFQVFKLNKYRRLLEGLFLLFLTAIGLLMLRIFLMGNKPPEFAPSDNPAADSKSFLTRTLTFHHLLALNFGLLICPRILSFDWSMNSIPLVESLTDSRNLSTIAFYCGLVYFAIYILKSIPQIADCSSPKPYSNGTNSHIIKALNNHRGKIRYFDSNSMKQDQFPTQHPKMNKPAFHCLVIAVTVMIVPFIPATNLFFYVGFVIAERVLYIPSMGFCLLVAKGASELYTQNHSNRIRQGVVLLSVLCLLVSFSVRTILRNQDWETEERLYGSGIIVNPAKAWGNLANVLNGQGKKASAEIAYRNALQYRSNMADVHYNLGILLQDQKRYNEAIESYKMAILCRPKLTMAYLNLGIVYALLEQYEEAEKSYQECAGIDINGLRDPRLHESTKISALYNLGRMYTDLHKYQLSIDTYNEAIQRAPAHYAMQSIYNMLGEAYFKSGNIENAEYWYKEALRVKPNHLPAHITMAKLLQRKNQIGKAEKWFLKALMIDTPEGTAHQHYAQFLGELGRHAESVEIYKQVLQNNSNDFELVFNTANAMRQSGNNVEAEELYRRAAALNPKTATAHMNLGAILHLNGKLEEAERSYKEALRLKPDDSMTKDNLAKLQNLMHNQARVAVKV